MLYFLTSPPYLAAVVITAWLLLAAVSSKMASLPVCLLSAGPQSPPQYSSYLVSWEKIKRRTG